MISLIIIIYQGEKKALDLLGSAPTVHVISNLVILSDPSGKVPTAYAIHPPAGSC
jgi:hypothetical protein